MRAAVTQFGRFFSKPSRARGGHAARSTVRQLACEPLTKRYVLSATPLMDIAIADEPLPDMTCSPTYSMDPATEISLQNVAGSHLTAPSEIAMDPGMEAAALDAAFAEMATDELAGVAMTPSETSPESTAPTLDASTDPGLLMGPTYPVMFGGSLDDDSTLDSTEEQAYWDWWDSWTAEGEIAEADPAGMTTSPEDPAIAMGGEIDPWDEPMEGEPTGNYYIGTFAARPISTGWMLEGNVSWGGEAPTGLVVHFGGIAEGHTVSVYPDGNFFYYISFPPGWGGTVVATAYDSEGLSSNNAYTFIWA